MSMTFTDDIVASYLVASELANDGSGPEKRERLALYFEKEYEDFVAAWEVRTGRPWTEMTQAEAREFVRSRPANFRNPAVLSKILD